MTKDTGGLPVAPSMDVALATVDLPREEAVVGPRTVRVAAMAVLVGIAAAFLAAALMALIGAITNAVYYRRLSAEFVSPAGASPGFLAAVAVPSRRPASRSASCRCSAAAARRTWSRCCSAGRRS